MKITSKHLDIEQQKKKEISIIKQDLKYLEKKLDYYIDYFLKEIKGVS